MIFTYSFRREIEEYTSNDNKAAWTIAEYILRIRERLANSSFFLSSVQIFKGGRGELRLHYRGMNRNAPDPIQGVMIRGKGEGEGEGEGGFFKTFETGLAQ